ncbi:MAG: FxDxF family PEP-CTERM protein [Nitrosomonas sp.]|uniref:FxDxF family PEP-CTERM protein n=1 Tax=Nitrosomonas sp. TaxID=42353 RepID=UPI001A400ABA|nr:FxDxF family PEP-CTERM protein [Nitrosomonas sp.]MBL8500478.1 FxDxF family PEP-CTERM protein [Nitrosomonas sp.]UJP01728.1 MAG: FxDxF family PEP-CTERM protein [Nitrosomonas sp.]
MILKKLAISIIATGALIFGSGAQANTYSFGQLLSGGGPANVHFADLSVTDDGGGNWTFTLTTLDLNAIFGTDSFIGSMAVDGTKPSSSSTDLGGGVTVVDPKNGGGPGGSFDFRYDFGSGGASDRLTANESVTWHVGGLGSDPLPIDGQLALHVQATKFAPDSAWYVSPVPEPETYAMLLAGLGLLGFMARRRKESAM